MQKFGDPGSLEQRLVRVIGTSIRTLYICGCIVRISNLPGMPRERSSIKVLIADDHAVFRDGLRKLLEGADDISVVGEASNGNQCIKMLGKFKPDILLLDLRMPEKDGLAVLTEVNFESLSTRVIVLTAAEDDRGVVRAMRLGARGVVLKQSASDLLLKSIRQVHDGEIWRRSQAR